MKYDVVVIGGGPAGMLAAGTASSMGRKTLLLEKNDKLGRKLFITGKGRCNVTNSADFDEFMKNIPKNTKFFYSAFHSLSNNALIELLNSLGLRTKVERGGRVFPESDKSSDVIKTLEKYINKYNVAVRLGTKVSGIKAEDGAIKGVKLENGDIIECESLILCTGGISYPQTGSTGDGYEWARKAGHTVTDLQPSLVPLIAKEEYIKELQGLSLKNVSIKAIVGGKVIYNDFGEMLFTHYGLTGPIILSSSFYVSDYIRKKSEVKISIDLKPALTEDELDKRILRDFEKNTNKHFKNSLDELLPKKMIPVILALSGINEEKEVHQITKLERKHLVELLKNFTCTVIDTRPVAEAIVTSGGINLKEINPKTMESKIVKGLFFAGEILDLDAFTGGFNLQIAFSTGYVAGLNA
ncbi:MAG: NAD(P)/FAD-dependent oxidoreductase [Caulobacteraceae bacterium]